MREERLRAERERLRQEQKEQEIHDKAYLQAKLEHTEELKHKLKEIMHSFTLEKKSYEKQQEAIKK